MCERLVIVGAGLAGCALAWQLHRRGQEFTLIESDPEAAGSLVAAGMLAPVTGKAFNPSWRIDEFYAPAMEFYAYVEAELGRQLWFNYPVVRLFFDAKDRCKFEKKHRESPDLQKWVSVVSDEVYEAHAEYGAVTWASSGRLDVGEFVKATREFFATLGAYQVIPNYSPDDQEGATVYTTGGRGLIESNPIELPNRCAKGEILMVKAPTLPQDRIISRGTWLVPTGRQDSTFLVGANYDWDDLSNTPTEAGRETVESGLRSLVGAAYEVVEHVAGVRPIVRRSEPVISALSGGNYYLNGLGSKGVLYAPRATEILAHAMLDGGEIPDYLKL